MFSTGPRRAATMGWVEGSNGRTGTSDRTMTIMRATSALCLVLLSGCAGAMRQQPGELTIIDTGPRILHINGTFEPVTFVVDAERLPADVERRGACQTNDPMPVALVGQAIPQMLRSQPLYVAPMPNYCPVTAPIASRTVVVSGQNVPEALQRPAPSEPQP